MADPTQIDQVLINLVANARDAVSPGGQVIIRTAALELDESYGRAHGGVELRPGLFVCLSVSDTGTGMDRDTLSKIFEPFFTTKPVGRGTGLGLSTVYGIVKQHRGFVWAYSERGLGTTVKVYLPAAGTESGGGREVRASGPQAVSAGGRQATILVVEDEPGVRALACRILGAAGYHVIEAPDGRHALERLERERPNLVITDVVMPSMNGGELGQAVAARFPSVPLLYMSGYPGDEMLERGLLPLGVPFLQKPFSPDGLLRQVASLLGG